jgi:hypothetical protein
MNQPPAQEMRHLKPMLESKTPLWGQSQGCEVPLSAAFPAAESPDVGKGTPRELVVKY